MCQSNRISVKLIGAFLLHLFFFLSVYSCTKIASIRSENLVVLCLFRSNISNIGELRKTASPYYRFSLYKFVYSILNTFSLSALCADSDRCDESIGREPYSTSINVQFYLCSGENDDMLLACLITQLMRTNKCHLQINYIWLKSLRYMWSMLPNQVDWVHSAVSSRSFAYFDVTHSTYTNSFTYKYACNFTYDSVNQHGSM